MKKVAVIFGGDSGEYEVSVNSASVVVKHLDRSKYHPYLIRIKKDDWSYTSENSQKIQVDKNDFSLIISGEKVYFDCVFNVIHGTPGEDGKLSGYFDLLKIPYTSSSVLTSALTFNKEFCNQFIGSAGFSVAKSIVLEKGFKMSGKEIISQLGLPVFVKPNKGGSSVGTFKVTKQEALMQAIDSSFLHDDQVMVESFIEGTELTCGVLKINGRVVALPITEIVSKTEFFDYEAKYHGKADEITPARISETLAKQTKQTSVSLYELLHCRGVVRFDYIYSKERNALFFIDANTVPGMSEPSIVPQQAVAYGLTLSQLFDALVLDASSG